MTATIPVPTRMVPATVDEALRARAAADANACAFTFLDDGDVDGPSTPLTYGELDRRARAIAVVLERAGLAGERALLLYPPGLDFIAAFFGCLYAGVVAVPAYPPDPGRLERSVPRLVTIARASDAAVILTTAALRALGEAMNATLPAMRELDGLEWIATDAVADGAAEWIERRTAPEGLALLQFTSGSTSEPKGVMVTHANLMHNVGILLSQGLGAAGARGVSWLPLYHDMGLLGGMLAPVVAGCPTVHLSPIDFLRRPYRWLHAVSASRATLSVAPNFAFDLCARKVTPAQRATLDLRDLAVVFCGAEPIRQETMARFMAAFGPCGFRRESIYPCYGLAEATLIVTGGPAGALPVVTTVHGDRLEEGRVEPVAPGDAAAREVFGAGRVLGGQRVVIADADGSPCAPDQVGEVLVSGPSVARGYWGRPVETAGIFGARVRGQAGTFLRTGDAGFFHDGVLHITGRLKDLIIVRGRNVAPQDIEQTMAASDPAVRPGCGAAFGIDVDGEEAVVVATEVDSRLPVDVAAVVDRIRDAVAAAHGLPLHAVVLLERGAIPKTSSGKIQRHACRQGYVAGTLAAVGAWRRGIAARELEETHERAGF